ncbi:hypothetical protein ASPWEDRAFT_108842 [Aspergillus wentii DTO 134E9]|uniref:chitinase n=1 Tax=Aspergillus wentii DTO 134E9 TaxID=1073089 RepID=A0A1L9RN86_ASPWE|nr:uncharacterized protein ASPWEDRAFT_108842 [Aspergillus wentii DTO 134E9]OJJ36372.1 hypothetical protein ASPWEDRAFT_108842 [Aspergillus wentii DTO 134E9]
MAYSSQSRHSRSWEWRLLVLFILFNIFSTATAQFYVCNSTSPCVNGACCGVKPGEASGLCGYDPDDQCSKANCVSNCDAKAECGKWAATAGAKCPLNVCCSSYGFCGTTSEFCDKGDDDNKSCQSNCGSPTEPSCSSNDVLKKVIGYYESWASNSRRCDGWTPNQLPAQSLTHLSFAKNLVRMLQKYGLNGADLDWEYPGADDRGGNSDDTENFAKLLRTIRDEFNASGQNYELSFTIPSSYWYLRHFDVPKYLASGADWCNMMSYDLHGVWDGHDPYIGKVVGAHTNLTEIAQAMDLLWRNDVDPSKIVLGIGFYGRSFTLSDPSCTKPGCPFSGGGANGTCTQTSGILSYKEIQEIITDSENVPVWEEEAGVMYLTWDENQWVSFDTNQTFKQKVDYANDHCLGGVMIWSNDQDTYDWQALSALLGKTVDGGSLLQGSNSNDEDAKSLVHSYNKYTGGDCYISDCVDWNRGSCKKGYSILDYVHKGSLGVISDPDDKLCKTGDTTEDEDEDSQYRLICCPTDAMPTCSWTGGSPDGFCTGGKDDTCGGNKFELVRDHYNDRTGSSPCTVNSRSLCCSTLNQLDQCSWTDCNEECEKSWYRFSNFSLNAGPNLNQNNEYCTGTAEFCCPSKDTLKNCVWANCGESCPEKKLLVTRRNQLWNPDVPHGQVGEYWCGDDEMMSMCCDPPSAGGEAPVDPADLFEYPDEDNVSWYEKTEPGANTEASDIEDEDPFGFVMIDGDTDAYDQSLVDQWTFLDDSGGALHSKRSTTEHNLFGSRDDTFDHVEETYQIKCSSLLKNDTGCHSIFSGGASNTIVKMPANVGAAGPYARVISLTPRGSTTKRGNVLPRSAGQVYDMKVDYDLAAAGEEEKGDVNFRVDFTNLQGYWDKITDSPAKHKKRWFGDFDAWLEKVTSIVKSEKGYLPLAYDGSVKLLELTQNCSGDSPYKLDLDTRLKVGLHAQYAYYFEGAILPAPKMIASYAYFSINPSAELIFQLSGEATFQSTTGEADLIDGIPFSGLSIKGLINIGPELGVTGSIDTSLTFAGELQAGVGVEFQKTEVYFPQDSDAKDATVKPSGLRDNDREKEPAFLVTPMFESSATASGHINMNLTPKVRFGISVLGGKLSGGFVTAGVENTISVGFDSSTTTSTSSGSSSDSFCYWADYLYSLFVQAEVKFPGDLIYWGSEKLELDSPDDAITLIDKKCMPYEKNVKITPRDDINYSGSSDPPIAWDTSDQGNIIAVNPRTDGEPIFSALMACPGTNDSVTDDGGDLCTIGSTKRATTNCDPPPALFYNCDYFPDLAVANNNKKTNGNKKTQTLTGICNNIKGYLDSHKNAPGVGSNWMLLTYWKDPSESNRVQSCGQPGGPEKQCTDLKKSLWPEDVQAQVKKDKNQFAARKMTGWKNDMSCDEFPFNACHQGGAGAATACAPAEQQDYQRDINGFIPNILDRDHGNRRGGDEPHYGKLANDVRQYSVNLFYGSQNDEKIGGYMNKGGVIYDDPNGKNPSVNPGTKLNYVIGGVNLQSDRWRIKKNGKGLNALCVQSLPPVKVQNDDKMIMTYPVQKCRVDFVAAKDVKKRGLDPYNTQHWVVDGEFTCFFFLSGKMLIYF